MKTDQLDTRQHHFSTQSALHWSRWVKRTREVICWDVHSLAVVGQTVTLHICERFWRVQSIVTHAVFFNLSKLSQEKQAQQRELWLFRWELVKEQILKGWAQANAIEGESKQSTLDSCLPARADVHSWAFPRSSRWESIYHVRRVLEHRQQAVCAPPLAWAFWR